MVWSRKCSLAKVYLPFSLWYMKKIVLVALWKLMNRHTFRSTKINMSYFHLCTYSYFLCTLHLQYEYSIHLRCKQKLQVLCTITNIYKVFIILKITYCFIYQAFLPVGNIIPAVDKKNVSRNYLMNDTVCCEVIEVIPDTDKMVCGMKGVTRGPDDPPPKPPLGLLSTDDFPLIYKYVPQPLVHSDLITVCLHLFYRYCQNYLWTLLYCICVFLFCEDLEQVVFILSVIFVPALDVRRFEK